MLVVRARNRAHIQLAALSSSEVIASIKQHRRSPQECSRHNELTPTGRLPTDLLSYIVGMTGDVSHKLLPALMVTWGRFHATAMDTAALWTTVHFSWEGDSHEATHTNLTKIQSAQRKKAGFRPNISYCFCPNSDDEDDTEQANEGSD